MNPFWMVLADLRKTLLSSLGILILLSLAFSTSVAVSLVDRALQQSGASTAQDFDLVVGAPGSKLDLILASVFLRTDEVLPLVPETVVQQLAADPRVVALSPLVLADHWKGHPIVGVGKDFPALRPTLRLASGHWPSDAFETVAGSGTGLGIGEQFLGSHGIAEREGVDEALHSEAAYRVVGRLEPTGTPWDGALITTFDSIWKLHEGPSAAPEPTRLRQVSAILVKPKDFAAAYSLRADYQKRDTTAAFPGEVLAGLFGVFDRVKDALSLVSLLFQTLVFAAVLLSLLAGLPSKAKWIGLLRALGAGRLYVFLTLWIQTALVLSAATLLGAVLGWGGAQALGQMVWTQTGLRLEIVWSLEEALVLGAFFLVGLLGALVPAVAGYRTSVRRALLG